MQIMFTTLNGSIQKLTMPAPSDQVLPGVSWGRFDELFTAAYWRGQAWQHERLGTYRKVRLGQTLTEEVAACILGGHGMHAESGVAAFQSVRQAGLLEGIPSASMIEAVLSSPLRVGPRVRFPRQKSIYVAAALRDLAEFEEPKGDVELRDRLLSLPGVGLKTASWIVRNY